jgi:hypothetical protein
MKVEIKVRSDSQTVHYSPETFDALAKFSPYTPSVPPHLLDLRCEYDVPRYVDILGLSQPVNGPIFVGQALKNEQLR